MWKDSRQSRLEIKRIKKAMDLEIQIFLSIICLFIVVGIIQEVLR
jgi:hypothetical protein